MELKIVKKINWELKDLTQKYLHDVLDRTDEIEKCGHLPAVYLKEYSKKVIELI